MMQIVFADYGVKCSDYLYFSVKTVLELEPVIVNIC